MKKTTKNKAGLVVIIISSALLVLLIVLTIGFFRHAKNILDEEYSQNETEEIEKNSSQNLDLLSPAETVTAFLKNILGTIPESNLDLQSAKKFITPNLKEEIDKPGFVPQTLCIQDGPTGIKISAENISGEKAYVRISTLYGNEWDQRWEFSLMLDKDSWKISSIKCLENNPTELNNYGEESIKDIPSCFDASVKSSVNEEGQQSIAYTTPVGYSGQEVLNFYDLNMPDHGWTKIASDGDRSRTYQHSDGRQAEIWIFYSNVNEGTDYIIECPPFTGHSENMNQ
jgi:hypothetical protein